MIIKIDKNILRKFQDLYDFDLLFKYSNNEFCKEYLTNYLLIYKK